MMTEPQKTVVSVKRFCRFAPGEYQIPASRIHLLVQKMGCQHFETTAGRKTPVEI